MEGKIYCGIPRRHVTGPPTILRKVSKMTAVTTVFPPSHPFDLTVWPPQPTSEWLINHDLPNITDLDELVFPSEPSYNENPMSLIDVPLDPSISEIDNLFFSKFIQESIQSGPHSVVASAESGEPRRPPQLPSGIVTVSRPAQRTPAVDHSVHINDANKHKDSLINRPSSLLATTLNDKITMKVDVKEEVFSPKVEIKQDQQIEKSPDDVTKKEIETKAQVKNQHEISEQKDELSRSTVGGSNTPYDLRTRKNSSNKPVRPTVRKTVVLWKFIKELLDNNDSSVSWISREDRTFRFVDSKQAAKLWGQRKNKRNMTYEKMSRALRYYYDRQIMYHIDGQKLMYKFGDGATESHDDTVTDNLEEAKMDAA
ncbi:ETS-related transcription factor Elf-2-like isoform X5 [Acropora muricata]|uniref:ETS-related transcription factor Elf-2-like isoform X5 n=1 Tax=Acropora muricata TaxID=159855 RepID=UPI0034E5EDBB